MADLLKLAGNGKEVGDEEGGAVEIPAAESAGVPLKERKPSWERLRHVDSLNLEAGRVPSTKSHGNQEVNWERTLRLAFQSIGVVYGDMGTSPLYVYAGTFTDGIKHKDDILGVLSLIIYTIVLLPLIKYAFVVLMANDNGDGGTFALYSLVSRYAKVGLVPNQQAEDAMVSNYKLETPSNQFKRAHWIKKKLENSMAARIILFFVTILGTSMVIGDGVLTPCISVLSAISGIKEKAASLSEGTIAGISVAILVVLFAVQRFGTDKVGYSFAPIVSLWFCFISGIGLYNLVKHDITVLKAFNPKYIIDYFKRNGKQAWISLGGVVLCITGTEAMFADLGHFNMRAIQIGFTGALLPAVSLAYIGQAAYLTKHPENVGDTFYKSIPTSLFWPTFIVAVAAAIVASQAMISGAFAIISQSQTLSCFPRVKVIHTSSKYHGQVYIPEINYALMFACVLVTAIFKNTTKIGNAYGIAVVFVMFITTCFVTLVMLLIWKTSIVWIALFLVIFGSIELVYLSSVLYKFKQGGYLPLAFAAILMVLMAIWHYVHVERYKFELRNKVSSGYITELAKRKDLRRIPGIGLLYSEVVQGIPPIFPHFVENIPCIQSVLVFVSIKYLPISTVEMKERYLFRQVEPREFRMFRCVVRYGYNDAIEEPSEFERLLIDHLKDFIFQEHFFIEAAGAAPAAAAAAAAAEPRPPAQPIQAGAAITAKQQRQKRSVHVEEAIDEQLAYESQRHIGSSGSIQLAAPAVSGDDNSGRWTRGAEAELEFIQKEMEKGVVYMLGEAEVVAHPNSNIFKKVVVNNLYYFIRRNFRQVDKVMAIPHSRLLRVGMTCEI